MPYENVQPGDIVPGSFNPAVVVGSYFVSFSGCLLTIELLHRRGTALGSWRSWFENVECAIAMGVVGIWCMHFIGNRAITLGNGEESLQLVYASGFTALSVFLPVIGLTAAFAAAEYRTAKPLHHWLALTGTGIIAGLSIVGMHYVGNLGITNYTLQYNRRFLAAAFIIAEGDCLVVLVLFYTWREKWINSWWKKLFCAVFLAGGVSAMHFTASVGCLYVFEHHANADGQRNVQVLIAGVLCGAAVLTFFGYLFFTRHKGRNNRKRAQRVVLACAVFDSAGKILVNTDGTIPAAEITDKDNLTGFADDLNIAHPVLHWMFRVSYNWPGVSDLVPKMRSHLIPQTENCDLDSRPGSSCSSAFYDPSTYSDYSIIFRERFCVAAANLASNLNVPLEKLGVLHDKIIETAAVSEANTTRRGPLPNNKSDDIEMTPNKAGSGKGQIIFVVREVDSDDADRLLNSGFRFATLGYVVRNMADALQLPAPLLESHCTALKRYVQRLDKLNKPGTWLSLFAPIPKVHGGFDIAVNKYDQNQLPDAQLLKMPPQQWQHGLLVSLDGLHPHACIRQMEKRLAVIEGDSPQQLCEKLFVSSVINAIQTMSTTLPPEWFSQSRFVARKHHAHYSTTTGGQAVPTILYSFVVMADMHVAIDAYDSITRVPMSFFAMRQRCYAGSPDHQVFARDIHAEFGPLIARKTPKTRSSSRMNIASKLKRNECSQNATDVHKERQSLYSDTDTSSENGLIDKVEPVAITTSQIPEPEATSRDNLWGGILVNSETIVTTDSRIDSSQENERGEFGAPSALGFQTVVGPAKQEDTFVDDLMSVIRAKYVPPKPRY